MFETESSQLQTLLIEVETLRSRTSALELLLAKQRRIRRKGVSLVAAGVAVILLGAGVAAAADGLCPGGTNGLPFCFAANSPALASQINHNFSQLKEWLEQKTGTAGSANVTHSGTTIHAGTTTLTGTTTMNGTATINNTLAVTGNMRIQTGGTPNGNLAATRALVVTSNMGDGLAGNGGVEFRHDNQTQGIGFGYNTIYATGSNPHNLNLKGYGGGIVNVEGDFQVSANVWGGAYTQNPTYQYSDGVNLVWSMCGNGTYVCGLGVGHNGGDNNYWTGVKAAIRCCPL